MDEKLIERDIQEKVGNLVRISSEGLDRYRVFTPFMFEDGDHLSIVLRRDNGKWFFTDEGHTYMHLTYEMDEKDLQKGTRQKIISNTLTAFRIEDIKGQLILNINEKEYGNALYNYVQGLLKITDVTYLSRERVSSTFFDDFRELLSETVNAERLTFDWFDRHHDPKGNYQVNCHINSMKTPLFIFALNNDSTTRDATISLLQFERWGLDFHSIGIFEDQEEINRKVLARFSDIFEKQYSSLHASDRIADYIKSRLEG